MTSKPAIALYLGESYATIGLFDTENTKAQVALFEKSIFLPQVSLKNLLSQAKLKYQEFFTDTPAQVFIVTKYFDRLKQFRLGGSISQVILKGFENSYALSDSKSLSLAAAQLIISIDDSTINEATLTRELERVKKINPDLNKVVIAIPEDKISATELEKLHLFFLTAGLKIFTCKASQNQSQLRKTLLNAGSEGTKEEIISEMKEAFGEKTTVNFFCTDGFQNKFENSELFNSANNFLAQIIKTKKFEQGAFFDIESLKFIKTEKKDTWLGPWGAIPVDHYSHTDLYVHPFSEVKLNHLALLHINNNLQQLEPGPVIAGRAIKPLTLDLFYAELAENKLAQNIFGQLTQDTLKSKISNLFSVLEKGQKQSPLALQITDLKNNFLESLQNEILLQSGADPVFKFGPLADIFCKKNETSVGADFSWTNDIITRARHEGAL